MHVELLNKIVKEILLMQIFNTNHDKTQKYYNKFIRV